MPGITPSPRPLTPLGALSKRQMNELKERRAIWDRGYDEWKHITCPCGHGYFDSNGEWVSGADVRDGRSPPNPLWAFHGGVSPSLTRSKFQGELYDRY